MLETTWMDRMRLEVPRENYISVDEYAEAFNAFYFKQHMKAEKEMVDRFVDKIKEIKSKYDLNNENSKLMCTYDLEVELNKITYEYIPHIDPTFNLEIKGSNPRFFKVNWCFKMDDKLYMKIWPLCVLELTNVTIDMNTLEVDIKHGLVNQGQSM